MERQPWPSERLDEVYAEVRSLLRGVTLERFLASKPPSSVVTLQAGESCASALRTLAARGISSAPVFDEDAYTGFVDACDILTALLDIVDVRALTDDNRAFKLRGAGLQLEHQPLRSLSPTQDGALIAYRADLQATLHDVLLYGILQPNAAGATSVVHRVGVFDTLLPDDEGECAASGTILRGIRYSAGTSHRHYHHHHYHHKKQWYCCCSTAVAYGWCCSTSQHYTCCTSQVCHQHSPSPFPHTHTHIHTRNPSHTQYTARHITV